ncbi:MAG: hypothetical protein WC468_03475 [Candidatus Paceibacterota bacterium]
MLTKKEALKLFPLIKRSNELLNSLPEELRKEGLGELIKLNNQFLSYENRLDPENIREMNKILSAIKKIAEDIYILVNFLEFLEDSGVRPVSG